MSREMQVILDKIKEYDKILIFRHTTPDGDAVGSTLGLRDILRASFPEKQIYVNNCDYSDYVAFLGKEDEAQSDEFYAQALGIVVDTATERRISNPRYKLCREICKIDHHIPLEPYGNYMWVEEHRSAACEMIAAFYNEFKSELKMPLSAATAIYGGLVTDSGRFRFRSVSGDTLRLAGMLVDCGVDLDTLYAHLYMKEFETTKFHAYVLSHIKFTESGVAHVYINRKTREKFGLTYEQACTAVGYMDSIKGSLMWIAFIEADSGEIRVRLRSRFVTINEVAEQFGGGGHDCASGATVTTRREMNELVAAADARHAEYKRTHEGWL